MNAAAAYIVAAVFSSQQHFSATHELGFLLPTIPAQLSQVKGMAICKWCRRVWMGLKIGHTRSQRSQS